MTGIVRTVVVAALVFGGANAFAETCAPQNVSYMAVEPVRELLVLKGETRKQYLDRVYGRWQEDDKEVIRPSTESGVDVVRIGLTTPPGFALERADVLVEAELDYLDASNQRTTLFGHREIGRYALEADATSTLAVPRTVFRETGALIIAVSLRAAAATSERLVLVRTVPIDLGICPRRVYVADRFTAIRLNNKARK